MTPSTPAGQAAGSSSISGYKLRQLPNFTPQQMQMFQSLLGHSQQGVTGGVDYLSGLAGGNEDAFARAEAPAYRAFDKSIGQLGSRFAGLGAIDSSAFQNAAAGASRELGENLGAQRNQLQQNAIDRLLGLSGNLLGQRPYENILQQQKPKKKG